MSAKSTYELIADKQIKVGHGALCNLTIITDGTNDARVILYDVAAVGDVAVTNKLVEVTVLGGSHYGGRTWFEPVLFTKKVKWCQVVGETAASL